jgi:hypothetical protein
LGPTFNISNTIKSNPSKEKPRELTSYEDIIGIPEDPNKGPIYPSIDFNSLTMQNYSP